MGRVVLEISGEAQEVRRSTRQRAGAGERNGERRPEPTAPRALKGIFEARVGMQRREDCSHTFERLLYVHNLGGAPQHSDRSKPE